MEKLGYSRATQKLIYWLLDDFANIDNAYCGVSSDRTYNNMGYNCTMVF